MEEEFYSIYICLIKQNSWRSFRVMHYRELFPQSQIYGPPDILMPINKMIVRDRDEYSERGFNSLFGCLL